MPQLSSEKTVTDVITALSLLAPHGDGMYGFLHVDGSQFYIAERVGFESSSDGDYSIAKRRHPVVPEIVVELRRRRLVELVIMMGPLLSLLMISDAGFQWLSREKSRRSAGA